MECKLTWAIRLDQFTRYSTSKIDLDLCEYAPFSDRITFFLPMFAIHSSDRTEESKWTDIVTSHYADMASCISVALNAEKSLLPFPGRACMIETLESLKTTRGVRTTRWFYIFYVHAGNIWADMRISSSHHFRRPPVHANALAFSFPSSSSPFLLFLSFSFGRIATLSSAD